jgi:hypothetical protein
MSEHGVYAVLEKWCEAGIYGGSILIGGFGGELERSLLWKLALGCATAEAGPGPSAHVGLVRGVTPPTLH